MPTEIIVFCSVLGGFFIFILGCLCNQGIRSFFCKHEWEEVYRADSYSRESDIKKGLKGGVDIGYVCKKCKRVKTASIEFTPINNRKENCC